MEGSDGKQHHIRCGPGDVGRYVLLPGDPGRCPLIAQRFDEAWHVASNREYVTYTGTLLGEKVSVTSTGIGGPSTAIAVEELAAIGADTFIRVGTSGGMQRYTQPGDLVVAMGAVRDEGTAAQYMPMAFPAVAHIDVVNALRQAADIRGARYHTGVVHSKDSFYGEVEPYRMPVAQELIARWRAWVQGGVLCSEMEAATLFVVSAILGKRAGGLMLVMVTILEENLSGQGSHAGQRLQRPTLDQLLETAVEGLRVMIRRDRGS